jgi:hypothetical protein
LIGFTILRTSESDLAFWSSAQQLTTLHAALRGSKALGSRFRESEQVQPAGCCGMLAVPGCLCVVNPVRDQFAGPSHSPFA